MAAIVARSSLFIAFLLACFVHPAVSSNNSTGGVTGAFLNVTRNLPFDCAAVVHHVFPNASYPIFNNTNFTNVTSLESTNATFPNVTLLHNNTVFIYNGTRYRFVLSDGVNKTWSTSASAANLTEASNVTLYAWCQEWPYPYLEPVVIPPDPPSTPLFHVVAETGGATTVSGAVLRRVVVKLC